MSGRSSDQVVEEGQRQRLRTKGAGSNLPNGVSSRRTRDGKGGRGAAGGGGWAFVVGLMSAHRNIHKQLGGQPPQMSSSRVRSWVCTGFRDCDLRIKAEEASAGVYPDEAA